MVIFIKNHDRHVNQLVLMCYFQKTHDMHINQLVVMVDGWQKLSPVSVDKVGVYFRHAYPDRKAPVSIAASAELAFMWVDW